MDSSILSVVIKVIEAKMIATVNTIVSVDNK